MKYTSDGASFVHRRLNNAISLSYFEPYMQAFRLLVLFSAPSQDQVMAQRQHDFFPLRVRYTYQKYFNFRVHLEFLENFKNV